VQEVQVSFSGANVDAVVKWLAEVTGKSIVKHKGVACQLTIVSPRKLPQKDAIRLVYRALAVEGFSAIERGNYIIIVPEAMEPKMGDEVVGDSQEALEGKQILVKVFQLQFSQCAKLKEKVKGVLSEKGKLDVDLEGNKLIVTDFADNVKLLGELIRELDVPTSADSVIEIFTLKFAEAEELGKLLGAIFGGSAGKIGVASQPPPGQPQPAQPPSAPPPPPAPPTSGSRSASPQPVPRTPPAPIRD